MSFSISRWFQETIIERAKRILWTRFATEMETEALLDYADQLNRIEEQAAEYEANGKPHLAQMLRSRAADITPENPIAAAERAARLLSAEQQPGPALPALSLAAQPKEKSANKPIVRSKGRGRPKKADAKRAPAPPIEPESGPVTELGGRGE